MAVLPKHRLLRAINKAGLATPQQIAAIDRKITHDRIAQRDFKILWRLRSGSRFSGGMAAFVGWVIKHWPEIKIALGIVALFLDEEPEAKPEGKPKAKPKAKAKPKPKKVDNPWTSFVDPAPEGTVRVDDEEVKVLELPTIPEAIKEEE